MAIFGARPLKAPWARERCRRYFVELPQEFMLLAGFPGRLSVERLMQIEALKRAQLPVLSHHGRWLICFRGKRAEFVDRASALREAVEQAFQYSKNGTPTEVICVDDSLNHEVIWTYGIDPDPPGAGRREAGERNRAPRAKRPVVQSPQATRTAQITRWRNTGRKSRDSRQVG
jgi:hypothetical protein